MPTEKPTKKPLQLAHPPGDNGMSAGAPVQVTLEPEISPDMSNEAILRQTYAARRTWQFLVDSGQMDTQAKGAEGEVGMSASAEKVPPTVAAKAPAPSSSKNPESGLPAEQATGDPLGTMVMQAMEGIGWPIQEMQNWDGKTKASFTQVLDSLGSVLGITLPKILPKGK